VSDDWECVGIIGVDAGLCWVGDPCYVLKDRSEARPKDIGKDWHQFCARLSSRERGHAAQWNYDAGHAGLGVTVGTGHGDGSYPVMVRRNAEGRVMAVMVDFDPPDEDGEEIEAEP
jgi:hypothetical protein